MKQLKYVVISISLFLWFASAARAETDLLNLSAYAEGSSPPYGENIVVGQDEKTDVKWITRGKEDVEDVKGKLKFPINLAGEFEVLFELQECTFSLVDISCSSVELFLTADEYKVKIDVDGRNLYAGNESTGGDQSGAWTRSKNAWKLSVSNNVAKLYINDVFSQKITLKPDLTYTQLLIQGIKEGEQVYALKADGSGGSTQPPVTGGDFESGKQAGIQQCVADPASCGITVTVNGTTDGTNSAHATYSPTAGEVHIPFIDVPGPFGGTQTYEVYLIQQPLGFAFDLDMNRITLK